jgi:hypothetical protein
MESSIVALRFVLLLRICNAEDFRFKVAQLRGQNARKDVPRSNPQLTYSLPRELGRLMDTLPIGSNRTR